MAAFIAIPPEKLEQARVMYEEGEETLVEIAAFLGISKPTFCNRLITTGWRRRRRSPSPERAARAAARAFAERSGKKAPPPDPLEEVARGLRANVLKLRVLQLLEQREERAAARAAARANSAASEPDTEVLRAELRRRVEALRAQARDEG